MNGGICGLFRVDAASAVFGFFLIMRAEIAGDDTLRAARVVRNFR
ncbi:hypothetical protein [Acetobacter sp. AN02]|nr:hypothetical protein [Acetobacter sp. AN02]